MIFTAKVTAKTKGGFTVVFGNANIGFLPKKSIHRSVDADALKIDDEIQVVVEGTSGNAENLTIEVSNKKAVAQYQQDSLRSLSEGEIITGEVADKTDKGVYVTLDKSVGTQGFVPIWQLDKPLTAVHLGETMVCKVITIDGTFVKLSQKKARKQLEAEALGAVTEGGVYEVVVTARVPYGVFVRLNTLEGLLHNNDMLGKVKVGETIEVKLVKIEHDPQRDRPRLTFSQKELRKDRQQEAVLRYTVGQVVTGTVAGVQPYGVFVQLDDSGLTGLVRSKELVEDHAPQVGETITVGILDIKNEGGEIRVPLSERLGVAGKSAEETAGDSAETIPVIVAESDVESPETARAGFLTFIVALPEADEGGEGVNYETTNVPADTFTENAGAGADVMRELAAKSAEPEA
jgi:small subunit ribosomal protein S1